MELKKGDCLELLRELPDKSVDLVYTDVPYDIEGNGGGGCFGEKKRDYHSEYYSVSNNKTQKLRDYHSEYIDTLLNPNASRISKAKSSSSSIAEIAFGFDDSVLDELVRVMKKIYIYGVVKNKYQSYSNTLKNIIAFLTSFVGVRQTLFQHAMEHI